MALEKEGRVLGGLEGVSLQRGPSQLHPTLNLFLLPWFSVSTSLPGACEGQPSTRQVLTCTHMGTVPEIYSHGNPQQCPF